MKRLFSLSILCSAIASCLSLTACGNAQQVKESQQTEQEDTTQKVELETAISNGTLLYDKVKTKADGKGKTLTVYSYDSFTSEWGPAPKLKELFEKDCDCLVEFVPFEDGVTMFNRLRLEGDRVKADVVIGLDNNLLKEARKSDLFAQTDLDLSHLKLPIDSVSNWTSQIFIPYDYGQYAFIYDKNKLKNPPTSLKQLVENQKISVIYQDPRTSTVGRGLLTWMNHVYGSDVKQGWKTLAQHTVTVGKGWSETYGAFLKGEADMVLSYNTSPLYHQINESKDNYLAAEFTEGHVIQIELASRLKSTDTPELAEDFLAFLITPEAQSTIALSNIMLPVIETAVEPKFDKFVPYQSLKVSTPDDTVSKDQIRVWQTAVSQ